MSEELDIDTHMEKIDGALKKLEIEDIDLTESEVDSVLKLICVVVNGCNRPTSAILSLMASVSITYSKVLAEQSSMGPEEFKRFCDFLYKEMKKEFNSIKEEKK